MSDLWGKIFAMTSCFHVKTPWQEENTIRVRVMFPITSPEWKHNYIDTFWWCLTVDFFTFWTTWPGMFSSVLPIRWGVLSGDKGPWSNSITLDLWVLKCYVNESFQTNLVRKSIFQEDKLRHLICTPESCILSGPLSPKFAFLIEFSASPQPTDCISLCF